MFVPMPYAAFRQMIELAHTNKKSPNNDDTPSVTKPDTFAKTNENPRVKKHITHKDILDEYLRQNAK